MPGKQQVIASTRNQTNADQAHRDRTDKQAADYATNISYVHFQNISVLHDKMELINHVENLIKKHQNTDEEVTVGHEEKRDRLTYQMAEKNLALSIARNVESAFKGFAPKIEVQNPANNEYYNILVTFSPKEE